MTGRQLGSHAVQMSFFPPNIYFLICDWLNPQMHDPQIQKAECAEEEVIRNHISPARACW
jgi:hypothetical protein